MRGKSCINSELSLLTSRLSGYRPREGYELHLKLKIEMCDEPKIGYRPREGYELHHVAGQAGFRYQVIVPVRGMSCIVQNIPRSGLHCRKLSSP